MLVISNRNVLFQAGKERFLLKKDEIAQAIPEWVAEHAFFKALQREGAIAVSDATSDKEVVAAVEAAEAKAEAKTKATRKAKKK